MTIPQKILATVEGNPGRTFSYAQFATAIGCPSAYHCGQVIRGLVRKGSLRVVSHEVRVGTIYEVPSKKAE